MKRCIALMACLVALPAVADEGMWTPDNFPVEKVKARYGFTPDAKLLDHLRLSSIRFSNYCSASFVSGDGLIMTNHHCAEDCIAEHTNAQHDYARDGFYAKTGADELACTGIDVDTLQSITDVTDKVAPLKPGPIRDAEMGRLEKECSAGAADRRCEVVSLYAGGRFHLYAYQRYPDVRLVFVPETAIANFGGDPDNFEFPRHDFDIALLRAYTGGKPAPTPEHLRFSKKGAREGELAFVSGHPYTTERLLTIAQLEFERDVVLTWHVIRTSELRGLLRQFAERGDDARRDSENVFLYIENSYKGRLGRLMALLDQSFFAGKKAAEQAFRAKLSGPAATAYDDIAKAMAERRRLYPVHQGLEVNATKLSDLLWDARALVRGADERAKPDDKRLREFQEAALSRITQRVNGTAVIHPEVEKLLITFWLLKLREDLGPDHPAVKKLLGKEAPEELAARLVDGTKLADPAVRKALWDGGKKSIDASGDPLLRFMRVLDPLARAARKEQEDKVDAVVKRGTEAIAKARFELEGTKIYPDATGTLRFSYGQVKGWVEAGKPVKPFTTIASLFERATGRPPFELPASWLRARARLTATTPMNLVSTHDITGGNSGSPMVNQAGEVVGLIFDSTRQSLGGSYGYDESVQRAVALDSRAILHVLAKVYGADRLVQELTRP